MCCALLSRNEKGCQRSSFYLFTLKLHLKEPKSENLSMPHLNTHLAKLPFQKEMKSNNGFGTYIPRMTAKMLEWIWLILGHKLHPKQQYGFNKKLWLWRRCYIPRMRAKWSLGQGRRRHVLPTAQVLLYVEGWTGSSLES